MSNSEYAFKNVLTKNGDFFLAFYNSENNIYICFPDILIIGIEYSVKHS